MRITPAGQSGTGLARGDGTNDDQNQQCLVLAGDLFYMVGDQRTFTVEKGVRPR